MIKNRLATLRNRFAAARADADAANREVRRASSRRVAELQALTDGRALLAGLKDPLLTASDREQLARTISGRMLRPSLRFPRTIAELLLSRLRHFRYRWRLWTVFVVILIAVAAFAAITDRNSGRELVWFDTDVDLTFSFPEGHDQRVHFGAGNPVVVANNSAGAVRLRLWSEVDGYGFADIDANWFKQHAHGINR